MTDSNSSPLADWEQWPRAERVDYLNMTRSRAGLIAELSERCAFEMDEPDNTYRLTKPQLASITLSLRDSQEVTA